MTLVELTEGLTSRAQSLFSDFGMKVVDEFESGDYEFFLVQCGPDFYQIGMQRKGQDFTDMDQQFEKRIQPPSSIPFSRKAIKQKVDDWVNEYHKIWVGSENPEKMENWGKILKAVGYDVKESNKAWGGQIARQLYIEG